jgi:hypothetical protein
MCCRIEDGAGSLASACNRELRRNKKAAQDARPFLDPM